MTQPLIPVGRQNRYDVQDADLAQRIDELLKALEPYPHLDLLREVVVTAAKLAGENCDRGDLKVLRAALKELRHSFRVFSRYRGVPKVSIFGSSRSKPGDPAYRTTLEVAARLSGAGYMIVTGAGGGVMEAGNRGAGAGKSFGLNIALPFEQEANEAIASDEKLINFRYFFTRKLFFVKESHALILMPGGFGTQDEGFEVLTLLQTGRNVPTPVVMLDSPGGTYWKEWSRFVEGQMFDGGYLSPEDRELFLITDSVEEACREIQDFYRIYHSSRYVQRGEKLLLRLKRPLSDKELGALNGEFEDLLVEGLIESAEPSPEEKDEPEVRDLFRLSLSFNRRSFGRLRQLIDRINQE